jgi:lysozyme
MALDPQYLDEIRGFEGYSAQPAWDYKQSSSGYGTKAQPGDENIPPDQLKAVHDQRFQDEIGKAAASVDAFSPNLPPGVRAALTSLTYNAGPGWQQSGLGQAVKSGDLESAKAIFPQYNKAGGEVNNGLVARRAKELAWWNGQPQPPQASPAAPANGLLAQPSGGLAPPSAGGLLQAPLQLAQVLPAPRPNSAPIFSTQEGNSEKINDNISMAHPERIKRMEEMLRSGLIPRSTYDDYMNMIGRSAPQKSLPGAPLSLAPPIFPQAAPQQQQAQPQQAEQSVFDQMQPPQAAPIVFPKQRQVDLSKLRAALQRPPIFSQRG